MGALVQEPQASKREAIQNMMDDSKKREGGPKPQIYAFGDPSHQMECRLAGRRDWTRTTLHERVQMSGDCASTF